MAYVGSLLLAFGLWVYLGSVSPLRDAFRKAKESLQYMQAGALLLAIMIVLMLDMSKEQYAVNNTFLYIAAASTLLALWLHKTFSDNKPMKTIPEVGNVVQETMYDTGRTLKEAFSYRQSGKDIYTTNDVDIYVVDENKELLPHLHQEIADITQGRNLDWYEYRLNRVSKLAQLKNKIELSVVYEAVLSEALKALASFKIKTDPMILFIPQNGKGIKVYSEKEALTMTKSGSVSECIGKMNNRGFAKELDEFEKAIVVNDMCVEFAILGILEKAKNYKNVPISFFKSLLERDSATFYQDRHFLGACTSLGFTSIGRYGIAIYFAYKAQKYLKEKNKYQMNRKI